MNNKETLDKIETGRNLKNAWHVLIPDQLRTLIEKIARDEDRHPAQMVRRLLIYALKQRERNVE